MLKSSFRILLGFILCLSLSSIYAEEEAKPQETTIQKQQIEEPLWQKILKGLEKKIAEQKKKRQEQPMGTATGALGVRGAEEEKVVSQKNISTKEKLRFKEVKRASPKKSEPLKDSQVVDGETRDLEGLLAKAKTADQKTLEAEVVQFEKKYPKSSFLADLKELAKAKTP